MKRLLYLVDCTVLHSGHEQTGVSDLFSLAASTRAADERVASAQPSPTMLQQLLTLHVLYAARVSAFPYVRPSFGTLHTGGHA